MQEPSLSVAAGLKFEAELCVQPTISFVLQTPSLSVSPSTTDPFEQKSQPVAKMHAPGLVASGLKLQAFAVWHPAISRALHTPSSSASPSTTKPPLHVSQGPGTQQRLFTATFARWSKLQAFEILQPPTKGAAGPERTHCTPFQTSVVPTGMPCASGSSFGPAGPAGP